MANRSYISYDTGVLVIQSNVTLVYINNFVYKIYIIIHFINNDFPFKIFK